MEPEIILINSHGNDNENKIKMFNYDVIQSNSTGERNDGSAICVKKGISYQQLESLSPDTLAIRIQLDHEQLLITTFYSPPRKENLPIQALTRQVNYNNPTIIIADMNANFQSLGDQSTNNKGEQLETLNRTGKMTHHGPPFHTFVSRKNLTTPDKIISNKKFNFNLHLQQGPQTTSDHLPIIAKISVNPIQIPIKPRYSFKKVN